MKHTRFSLWLAAVTAVMLLALCPVAALAETTVANERQFSASLTLNEATNTYFIRTNGLYALYDAEGNQMSDGYAYMSAKNDGLFLSVANDSATNALGLLDRHGQLLLPMAYGQIEIESEKWILGIVLEVVTEEPHDYRALLGNELYRIVSADVYFKGQKIGTLGRADLADCSVSAKGNYLYVRRADRSGYYLSGNFTRIEASADDFSTTEFHEEYRVGIFHRASGQQAFVSTCTLTPDDVEQSVWYDDSGNFIDLQGNVISAGITPGKEYNYVSYNGSNYFRTRSNDGYGLALGDGTEVLPAVYESIGGGSSGERYFASGYQAVIRDGKLAYLDRAGNVTASVEYQMSDSDYRGFYNNSPFAIAESLGQKIVITATAGELPQRYQDTGYPEGGQRILAVKLDGMWGVIDLQGNTVIPFIFKYNPNISDDGTLVLGSVDKGYTLYTIAYTEDSDNLSADGYYIPGQPPKGSLMVNSVSISGTLQTGGMIVAQVDLWGVSSGVAAAYNYYLFDQSGMIVQSQVGSYDNTWRFATFTPGVYLVRVDATDGSGVATGDSEWFSIE